MTIRLERHRDEIGIVEPRCGRRGTESLQTLRWREADSNCESLSEIVPLAPGQMIGKSRADGGKILEQLGSWGGLLSASIRMPMAASQR
jgi:hypothetical protein